MGFLTAIIDALAEFVRRNPIFTLIVVVLALTAPALLKGIALFVLYLVLGFLVLIFALSLLFRWRIRRVQRQMEEQFGAGGFGGAGFGGARGARTESRREQEGEVKVYRTSETPEKRVSESVGDYVEFEETKEPRA
ncbi:MAG TPA: DUF4834 family protein [Candidatus Alistipes stercorigallinarum]|uniref:DUF4834 family protein n=1 Tax=uncultured Alistipes sp. TaxID=538949 RepID=UPI001F876E29|nr:DUF4834 family protein [uncultured Alistipes sp.]HJC17973.1 DUF4834 family protein [Candidatus Alistipes stercorigallinarum]